MKFVETYLPGNFVIDLEFLNDERGFFSRVFCRDAFDKAGLNGDWVQANNSLSSKRGTLRGLHTQIGKASEVKLVRCISGSIWDVVVDLRPNSPSFGRWFGCELSQENRKMMYVPVGCAHGFISLSDNSELFYLVSSAYDPIYERTLNWKDPNVAIKWPQNPLFISEKDENGSSLEQLMDELLKVSNE